MSSIFIKFAVGINRLYVQTYVLLRGLEQLLKLFRSKPDIFAFKANIDVGYAVIVLIDQK